MFSEQFLLFPRPFFFVLFFTFNHVICENNEAVWAEKAEMSVATPYFDKERRACLDGGGFEKKEARDSFCYQVHDYACNQTRIITNSRELQKLIDSDCSELRSSLIIANLHSSTLDLTVFSRIRKIDGNLIISGNTLLSDLSFDELTAIGSPVYNGRTPIMQITNNRMNSVNFPKLRDIHCQKAKASKCVVIGENWNSEGFSNMVLSFEGKELKTSEMLGETLLVGKQEKVVREEVLTNREYEGRKKGSSQGTHYTFEDLRSETFGATRLIDLGLAIGLLCFSFAVVGSMFYKRKRRDVRLLSDNFEYSDDWGLEIQDLSV